MRRTRVSVRVVGAVALLVTVIGCQDRVPSPLPAPSYLTTPSGQVPSPTTGPVSTLKPAVPPAAPSVNELLDRLEALKAKREAIQREEQKTLAELHEAIRKQQERMQKLGHPAPGVIPSPTPVTGAGTGSSYDPAPPCAPPGTPGAGPAKPGADHVPGPKAP
jgi:hypothetical protein